MTPRRLAHGILCGGAALMLGACQREAAPEPAPATPAVTSAPTSADTSTPSTASVVTTSVSCESAIGRAMADRIAHQCRTVAGETHPSCTTANRCTTMIDEIARNCVYGAGGNTLPQGCTLPTETLRATDAVVEFYVALNAKDFATAYHLWGQGGAASGKSLAEFQQGFADTRSTQLNVVSVSDVEGAAGSLYATVSVTLVATMNDGRTQRFRGDYIMRRVNDVPGASAEQLRWHIDSARLRPIR